MDAVASNTKLRLANNNQDDKGEIKRKRLSRTRLINLLNRINFGDGDITLHFRHIKYQHEITVRARPQICNNDFLRSLWSEHFDAKVRLKYFDFEMFSFTEGLNQIQVPAQLIEMNNNGVYLQLPEFCFEVKSVETKKYTCNNIPAQAIQDGKIVNAILTSFNARTLCLEVLPDPTNAHPVFNFDTPVNLVLTRNLEFIFSGNCKIIEQDLSADKNKLILEPVKNNLQLFKPKKVRSERLVLNPLPNILFIHPLTDKQVNLRLINLSGTGFSVAEDDDRAVLMPGMVIPELKIELVHGFSVTCRAQVVYRISSGNQSKCGVVILDMKTEEHVRLSSYLHQAKNKHSYIGTTNVDLDALWDFFFESGFIYPDKYVHIREQKERFQELYYKLYNKSPEVARHVIYQDKGKIYGHVSMFRYYSNTWLMHHHAAIRSAKHKAGLVVMEHILQYINECHTLPSAKMRYIACYFRPNNRFANRVFGGAARALEDIKKCSLDDFAYFHFEKEPGRPSLPRQWSIEETSNDDLEILKLWYNKESGGLLIDGIDLGSDAAALDQKTSEEYRQAGFSRDRILLSLKNDGELAALFAVNLSDLGMNMSDLTHCIQAFVLEREQCSKEILFAALGELAEHFEHEEVPVLLFPQPYADFAEIPYDKTYELTVLDLENISQYLTFMHSLTAPRERKVRHIS